MKTPPDESYTAAEAGDILGKSERQVLRYLSDGRLGGSRASGRWMTTALQIWKFQGIAEEMMHSWRVTCSQFAPSHETVIKQLLTESGE